MRKVKITRNNIIVLLSIILITICLFIKINDSYRQVKEERNEQNAINELIDKKVDTTIENKVKLSRNMNNKTNNKYNYIAVLETPKIGLKRGLVMATKNFKSINYAVSIDNNSKFPDEIGNFILYAHSGNSKMSYFDNIKKLTNNDVVKVYYENVWYTYQIFDKYEITKGTNLKIYNDGKNKYITLVTCSQEDKSKQIILLGKEG